MKKILLILLVFLTFSFRFFGKTINDSQIIPSDSNIYDYFQQLQNSARHFGFTHNTPVSVGELKFYLNQFDYDSLSEQAKSIYDFLYDYLYTNEDLTTIKDFELSMHPQINLELYYKTNKELPWSFDYFYKDNFLSLPLDFGYANNFAMGADFFLGKSKIAAAYNDNFWNIPINTKDLSKTYKVIDFYFPTFAYANFGKYNENWGYNLFISKQGKTIGNTLTGSIVYNSTFETDAFVEFDIYSSAVKFTMDVVQVSSNRMDNIQIDNTDRFLYMHQFDIRFFKNLKFTLIEGSLVANPFAIRFLNPLPFMHQFGGWTNYVTKQNKEIYNETNFCADFAYMLEYIPVSNLRLYGIYNQIEMQLPWERKSKKGRYYPNSIGLQLGAEYNLFLNNSQLLFNLEGFYNSPYMYIKQTPSSSLYRVRMDMQTKQDIYSWIGSPYGPDSAGIVFKTEYDLNKKLKTQLRYSLITKGKNDESLFSQTVTDENGEEYYNYYPSVKFILKDKEIANENISLEELYNEAASLLVSGIPQITNQIAVNTTYYINNNFEFGGQILYNYIINKDHIKNNKKQGIEFDLSLTYNIF